ncbi:MAG TPA: UDP-N-acetylmuramoyl-L-alanyl-D-glutamate--2,6-diaminopimelate ligase [Rhizomicrobium sp.]|nr:UDP-N-acetylmuramoyl-L-alanyl-D-glutamate--2,6-diaminopimelate ligase [Rhizomicrobium sp.]
MEPHSETTIAACSSDFRPKEKRMTFAGLASDSRDVRPGWLFAALPGTRNDGGAFIAEAVRRGATAVLGAPELRAKAEALGVRFIADENPRRRLAFIAAEHFGAQPETVAAITGTNGKTSVSVFLRQIWEGLGRRAASMGTIGVVGPQGTLSLHHTTPDAIALHRLLAQLEGDGVEHLALEASSHGLDQFRLDGVRIAAGAFTNLTHDHLDYHGDVAHYLAAKLRLFRELVVDGGLAVVNADAGYSGHFIQAARSRNLRLMTVGEHGEDVHLLARRPAPDAQQLEIAYAGRRYCLSLPLVGTFQASNALVAATLAIGLGDSPERVFSLLQLLRGAPGRLEKVAYAQSGAPIYVDYAHTPDALETVLKALRPHVQGRLSLVFGCGGDRDRAKRPVMGAIAARLADAAIVTDDNPRSENPSAIRAEILAFSPGAREIGDRAEAIRAGVAALETGDVLVIAGKGHESGQIVGPEVRPFLDSAEAIKAALAAGGRAAEAGA